MLARYSDSSSDAFEALHKDGKALGLPVTLFFLTGRRPICARYLDPDRLIH
jgi:hypothetical protein